MVILFLLFYTLSYGLSLDESLALYKSNNSSVHYANLKNDAFRSYVFKAYLNDSALGFSEYRDGAFQQGDRHIRSELTPNIKLFDVDISTSFRVDFNLGKMELNTTWLDAKFGLDIIDLVYYSSSSYLKDRIITTAKVEELSEKVFKLKQLYELVDIYILIKKLDGNLDVKQRFLKQLDSDRESLIIKEKAGLASKLELEAIDFEIMQVKSEINQILRTLYNNKIKFCKKIGIDFNDQEFLSFEASETEFIYDDFDRKMLEYKVKLNEIEAKSSFRNLLPKVGVGISYDWNEPLARYEGHYYASVNWDIWPSFAEYNNAQHNLFLNKEELAKLINEESVNFEDQLIKFAALKESISVSEKELEYLNKLIESTREKYMNDLISFDEYIKEYNKYKDKQVASTYLKYDLSAFVKKMELLREMHANMNI